jgi:hypothetical protein
LLVSLGPRLRQHCKNLTVAFLLKYLGEGTNKKKEILKRLCARESLIELTAYFTIIYFSAV